MNFIQIYIYFSIGKYNTISQEILISLYWEILNITKREKEILESQFSTKIVIYSILMF